MPLTKIALWGYYCLRCGHRWVPRGLVPARREATVRDALDPGERPPEPGEEPRVCPLCKSPYWNRPKREST
jgi:hypothetical protein